MNFVASEAYARDQDQTDPLAGFRERFLIPARPDGTPVIYLCGNSLGLQPRTARDYLVEELDDWGRLGVHGHFQGKRPWMPYHEQLTDLTAELVGAKPIEVVNMNSLTVNLHLMMVSFYRPTRERHKLLIEHPAFPSDRYAAESQVRLHGYDPATALLEIGPRPGESTIREQDLEALIAEQGEEIALIMLPGVQYYSGQAFDIARITGLAHGHGCLVGFDLAHAAGNLLLELHDWDVDFAVWCSYKYLNSGPGSVAGCFIHERHAQSVDLPRFAGWWGHDKATRFEMGPVFRAIPGAEGWQLSNPPIFALAPVLASLEIFSEAGMPALRAKSLRLTGFLEFLIAERLRDKIEILTPGDPEARGCQLSLRVLGSAEQGKRVQQGLDRQGVVTDWREPDVIRVAPVPLYNTFLDVYRFVELLEAL